MNKSVELIKMEPNTIEYSTLHTEIDDAAYMMVHINSNASHYNKLSSIDAINKTTTSGSIYDTVNDYICLEKTKARLKLGGGIGLLLVGAFAFYSIKKNKRKEVI